MSQLTGTRSPRSTRGVAAGVAVLGLALAGVVVQGRIADRGIDVVPVEAPAEIGTTVNPAPNPGGLDAQTRQKLADLRAQRDADLACAGMNYPQRAC